MISRLGQLYHVLSLMIGLGIGFAGYRLYRFAGFALGFGVGASLGVAALFGLLGNALVALVGGTLIGLLIGFVFHAFRRIGVFLIGALFGALLGALFGSGSTALIAAAVGGISALFLPKPFVVAGTSLLGGYLTVTASWTLSSGRSAITLFVRALFDAIPLLENDTIRTLLGLALGLGALCAVLQFSTTRAPRAKKPSLLPKPVERTPLNHEFPQGTTVDASPTAANIGSVRAPSVKTISDAEAVIVEVPDESLQVATANRPPSTASLSTRSHSDPGALPAAPVVTQEAVLARVESWDRARKVTQVEDRVFADASGRSLARVIAVNARSLPRRELSASEIQRSVGVAKPMRDPIVLPGGHGPVLIEWLAPLRREEETESASRSAVASSAQPLVSNAEPVESEASSALEQIDAQSATQAAPEEKSAPPPGDPAIVNQTVGPAPLTEGLSPVELARHTLHTHRLIVFPEYVIARAKQWELQSLDYRACLLTIINDRAQVVGRALLLSHEVLANVGHPDDAVQRSLGIEQLLTINRTFPTARGVLHIEF